jgi:hypothetical protein
MVLFEAEDECSSYDQTSPPSIITVDLDAMASDAYTVAGWHVLLNDDQLDLFQYQNTKVWHV